MSSCGAGIRTFATSRFIRRWPELGASLLEADRVSLSLDQAFIKEPGTSEVTHWHQDLPFWPALGNDIISLWVALTPVTVAGSGVEYVAVRTNGGKFYQAATPDKDAILRTTRWGVPRFLQA